MTDANVEYVESIMTPRDRAVATYHAAMVEFALKQRRVIDLLQELNNAT